MSSPKKPLIFDIIQGSYVDGPGLRTVIFLKGCPLRCLWCHNPEAQSTSADVFVMAQQCQSCSECAGIDCIYGAKKNIGIYYTPAEVVAMIVKNKDYFGLTGGVTFSGGEPLLWPEYLLEVCEALQKEHIKMCFDTSGQFNYDECRVVLQKYADLVLYDLKIIDPSRHLAYTGIENSTILNNFAALYRDNINIQPIIPLIPQLTAHQENLTAIAQFLSNYQLPEPIFKPFHTAMMAKHVALGKATPELLPKTPMNMAEQQKWQTVFAQATRLGQSLP